VLYSSGLVAGKRRQKKHIEPAKNATDATPFVCGDEKAGKPIILQKRGATMGDNRFPVVCFLKR